MTLLRYPSASPDRFNELLNVPIYCLTEKRGQGNGPEIIRGGSDLVELDALPAL